jgi:orotate phosphoribosyltransferase
VSNHLRSSSNAAISREEVLAEFRNAGALLEGHFILSSGLHSPSYLQCARVLMDARRATRLCAALADCVRAVAKSTVELVASPAMGGVIVGHEMGRQFGVPAIFFERVDGKLTLRRGFKVPQGAKVLMVEDIVTTGLSSRECLAGIAAEGGEAVAAACLIDRSGGKADLGVPLASLVRLDIPVYPSDGLPPELARIPAEKPGSRGLR